MTSLPIRMNSFNYGPDSPISTLNSGTPQDPGNTLDTNITPNFSNLSSNIENLNSSGGISNAFNSPISNTCNSISTSTRQPKTKFTAIEDDIIIRFVHESGAHTWGRIAPLLPGRTPRQVRERWVNYLSPDVRHEPFSEEEDKMILDLVGKFGKRWSCISHSFNQRTDVAIKNRYILLKRREKAALRKLQFEQQALQTPQLPQIEPPVQIESSPIDQPSFDQQLTSSSPEDNENSCEEQAKLEDDDCTGILQTIDLIADTESFPILDDAAEGCAEWDMDSYQWDDQMVAAYDSFYY
ncbi:hypothetical protein TRFO_31572 [Tritrichomonas foetus]|uniref:Myb-like DNA-binding domain containing protein n=1 Tax=Tritrichomonas foetus TaxID=1144522 RepID=A0A1J4JSY7_9EUKA|nr:hypothetical protein TRFO_31572 [Tritrichomonas foetus]|eukprot:OHT01544.1 hypothetical protein TRFO_31572 [Tritrichomonas foetus]